MQSGVCSFAGCGRLAKDLGQCQTHARQRCRGEELRPIQGRRAASERDEQGRKWCRRGEHWAPVDDFSSRSASTDRLNYECKECANGSKILRYGLTVPQYDAMLAAQGGGCGICGEQCTTGRKLSVDHDHSCCPKDSAVMCGKCVRGLLCINCNNALGGFRDSARLLLLAVDYVTRRA